MGWGEFPTVTLARARELSREAHDQIRQGINPSIIWRDCSGTDGSFDRHAVRPGSVRRQGVGVGVKAMDERWRLPAGVVLLTLLGLLAFFKARMGLLPEMLWVCHVSTALVAIGLCCRWAALSATGFLFHLAIGVPAFVADVLHTDDTMWPSLALHVLTPALGWWAWRGQRLPRWTPWRVAGLYAVMVALSRAVTPEALNVNLSFQPWSPFGFMGLWTWQVFNLVQMGVRLAVVQWLWNRWHGTGRPRTGDV